MAKIPLASKLLLALAVVLVIVMTPLAGISNGLEKKYGPTLMARVVWSDAQEAGDGTSVVAVALNVPARNETLVITRPCAAAVDDCRAWAATAFPAGSWTPCNLGAQQLIGSESTTHDREMALRDILTMTLFWVMLAALTSSLLVLCVTYKRKQHAAPPPVALLEPVPDGS